MLGTPSNIIPSTSILSKPIWPSLQYQSMWRSAYETNRAFFVSVSGGENGYSPSCFSALWTSFRDIRSTREYPQNCSLCSKTNSYLRTSFDMATTFSSKSGTCLHRSDNVAGLIWNWTRSCPKIVLVPAKVSTVALQTVSYVLNTSQSLTECSIAPRSSHVFWHSAPAVEADRACKRARNPRAWC